MKLVFFIVLTICFSIADYCYIKRKEIISVESKYRISGLFPKGIKQIMCFILIPISLISIAIMYSYFYEMNIFVVVKRLCIIGILWPIAITDFFEYRIPNKLVLSGLILRIIILIFELLFNFNNVLYTIINEGLAFIGTTVICIICLLITRGSLGMGDFKLMLIMSMFLGIEGMCYSIFISVFSTFIVAIVLLIFKKKSKNDVLPFAPFILIGTFISLILMGI